MRYRLTPLGGSGKMVALCRQTDAEKRAAGRSKILRPGIVQTLPCGACHGTGCKDCNGSGQLAVDTTTSIPWLGAVCGIDPQIGSGDFPEWTEGDLAWIRPDLNSARCADGSIARGGFSTYNLPQRVRGHELAEDFVWCAGHWLSTQNWHMSAVCSVFAAGGRFDAPGWPSREERAARAKSPLECGHRAIDPVPYVPVDTGLSLRHGNIATQRVLPDDLPRDAGGIQWGGTDKTKTFCLLHRVVDVDPNVANLVAPGALVLVGYQMEPSLTYSPRRGGGNVEIRSISTLAAIVEFFSEAGAEAETGASTDAAEVGAEREVLHHATA